MRKSNKFSPEVREGAVRLVQEHRGQYPSLWAAIESIAPKIGCVHCSSSRRGIGVKPRVSAFLRFVRQDIGAMPHSCPRSNACGPAICVSTERTRSGSSFTAKASRWRAAPLSA